MFLRPPQGGGKDGIGQPGSGEKEIEFENHDATVRSSVVQIIEFEQKSVVSDRGKLRPSLVACLLFIAEMQCAPTCSCARRA